MTDAATRHGAAVRAVRRTRGALGAVRGRRDARAVFLVTTVGYFVAYAFATNALALTGDGGMSVAVAPTPFRRMVQPVGYLSFEPVARVAAGPFTYLFSPIDAAVAAVLAVLVGANAALTYLGVVQPKACGLASSTGVLGSVPALFSGAACCGPLVFAAVGVQATATLLAAFRLLVPVALVLLVLGLLLVGRRVDPAAVSRTE